MTTQATKTAPKKLRAPKEAAAEKVNPKVKAAKAAPKPEKVAKPKPVAYDFATSYAGGPSGPLNARPSKTPIDFGKFGTHADAALTDRDLKSLADIRANFQKGQFKRANVDAGIIRRLGERGYIAHVSGSAVAPDAALKLTAKAFTPEAMQS